MPSKYGFGNTRKKSPYKMGKPHYGMDQKSPVKDWERFKAGIKGALRGAAANEGTGFPGYDPQGKYSKWGGKYPGSDIIQGWRGGVGMYDKKKADARRKQEEGKQE